MAAIGYKLMGVIKTGMLTTSGLALLASGCWVMYKDATRYPRMLSTFSRGCILSPLDECHLEQRGYFPRPDLEQELMVALESANTGCYHLVRGEVGTGKSRSVLHLIKQLMETEGKEGRGAPIYINAMQGTEFVDSLAEVVNFYFDEHINFSYFVDFVFRIQTSKCNDDHHRLARVLNAIEEASQRYAASYGRPMVLVIDGIDYLAADHIKLLQRIQAKGKLWAETGIAKLVFVTARDQSAELLELSPTNWSRADAPIIVQDLSYDDSIALLCKDLTSDSSGKGVFSKYEAEDIYDLVGGRIQNIVTSKQMRSSGMNYDTIERHLLIKERDKFIGIPGNNKVMAGLRKLYEAKNQSLCLSEFSELVGETGMKMMLCDRNIVRLQRENYELRVRFESKLTELTVKEYLAVRN